VLDPRISYEGLKQDYGDDLTLSNHLEDSKSQLSSYFNEHYAIPTPSLPPSTPVQHHPWTARLKSPSPLDIAEK
jgi:hypothetical protein